MEKKKSTRDYCLEKLELNKGSFIRGKTLAEELGVSRNAIWKAINELKNTGYSIKSVNNKGYSLDDTNDILSVVSIKNSMINYLKNTNSDTKTNTNNSSAIKQAEKICDSIIIYDQLASTNQTAKMSFITGALDKKIIIAKSQTSGQGHNNSSFDSPKGGIYMSIIIDNPNQKKASSHSTSTLSASKIGTIMLEVIQELTGKKAAIDKKYNRISIGKKKVCGILTEYFADLETNTINGYVIGIGIKNIEIKKNEAIGMILCKLVFKNVTSI